MRPLKFAFFLISLGLMLCVASVGSAAELDIRSQTTESRTFLGLGIDNSVFNVNGGDIKGFGGRIDFDHYFTEKVNVEVSLSSALNTENSVSSSFTGYGGYIFYSVWGDCCRKDVLVSVSGTPALSESRPLENILNIGVGLDQYMLYGTSSVYPASGLGYGANYQFNFANLRWKASVKKSNLSIGSTKIDGTSLGFSILFSL